MFGLDPLRSALLLLLLVIIALKIRGWRSSRNVVQVHIDLDMITPIEVQVRAHDLIEAGQFVEAVDLISRESQVSRESAEDVAKTLQAGHVLPDFPTLSEDDLPTRVRNLVSDGRRKEAVFLVRSRENMGQAKAEAFIDSLPSEPNT